MKAAQTNLVPPLLAPIATWTPRVFAHYDLFASLRSLVLSRSETAYPAAGLIVKKWRPASEAEICMRPTPLFSKGKKHTAK
eukprot:scaffold1634_cov95-Cylindrotheca_fusiformis.AAC.1